VTTGRSSFHSNTGRNLPQTTHTNYPAVSAFWKATKTFSWFIASLASFNRLSVS